MTRNHYMNKGIAVGIIVAVIIVIGIASYSTGNQNNDDLLSEDISAESTPETGTHHSIELAESITIKNTP